VVRQPSSCNEDPTIPGDGIGKVPADRPQAPQAPGIDVPARDTDAS
jgi:hypothetical protein